MLKNRDVVFELKDHEDLVSDIVFEQAINFSLLMDFELSKDDVGVELHGDIIFDFGDEDNYVFVEISETNITMQCNRPSGYISFDGFDYNNDTHMNLFNELCEEIKKCPA